MWKRLNWYYNYKTVRIRYSKAQHKSTSSRYLPCHTTLERQREWQRNNGWAGKIENRRNRREWISSFVRSFVRLFVSCFSSGVLFVLRRQCHSEMVSSLLGLDAHSYKWLLSSCFTRWLFHDIPATSFVLYVFSTNHELRWLMMAIQLKKNKLILY